MSFHLLLFCSLKENAAFLFLSINYVAKWKTPHWSFQNKCLGNVKKKTFVSEICVFCNN